jgi:Ca-activated chloride channel homolog
MEHEPGWLLWIRGLGVALLVLLAIAAAPAASAQEGAGDDDCPETAADGAQAGAHAVHLGEVAEAGLYFATGADGLYVPAPALTTDVDVRVTGLIARTRVTQRFANRGAGWVEGIYVFPLPETAAVDTLRLVVGDRVIEGEIREREQARQAYEAAKSAGVKASLVEQHRPNLFTTAVANIGPGEEVEVAIELQQTVDFDSGQFHLRFPTVVTPRFSPQERSPNAAPALATTLGAATPVFRPRPSVGAVFASTLGRPLGPPVAAAVNRVVDAVAPAAPQNPVRLSVDLDAGVPLDTIACPYHDFAVQPVGGDRYHITFADGPVAADRDLELVWTPSVGAEPDAALFAEPVDNDVYALLMVVPPDPKAAGFVPLPRETVFVVDTSGSMHGASLDQAKAALAAALDRLRPADSFNVIEFNSTTRALFPGSVAAEPVAIEQARRWVDSLEADGGTVMLPALQAALEPPPTGYRPAGLRAVKQVIFITDGAVDDEDELFAAIESMLGEARLFTVGIGSAPNGYFMRRAAEAGRGTFTYIGEQEEVRAKMDALFGKLERPALTDLEVTWDDPGAEVWPARIPDLYAGDPLVLTARLARLGDEVRITGMRDGQPWERRLRLGAATPGSGVGKLWARRKIDALLAGLQAGSARKDEIRQQVVDVALAHHLVSRYTSLVAVDVTPSRPAGEPLATRPVPLATPAGWTPPGEMPAGGTSSRLLLALGVTLLFPALLLGALGLAGRRGRPVAMVVAVPAREGRAA